MIYLNLNEAFKIILNVIVSEISPVGNVFKNTLSYGLNFCEDVANI